MGNNHDKRHKQNVKNKNLSLHEYVNIIANNSV